MWDMLWLAGIYAVASILAAVWVTVQCERPHAAWGWALAMLLCMPLAVVLYYLCVEGREQYGEVIDRDAAREELLLYQNHLIP